MTDADRDAEHRLAVLTAWGLFGGFSLAVALTGFRADDLLVIGTGYLLLVAGFVAHLVINRIYHVDFRPGEVVAAITLFGIAALAFMVNWAFEPGFSRTDVIGGILGLAVAAGCFITYLATRYGLKGAFSMFHMPRDS